VAIGEIDPVIASFFHVNGSFQGRCSRDKNHKTRCLSPPHYGHVAGVIDDALFLFVSGLMLLIHDHETETRKG
jgi:hypothetical protein